MKLNFYTDPSHGWLKVPMDVFKGLAAAIVGQISHCSYMTPDAVFLEEDSDAPKFIKHLREKGVEVDLKFHSVNNSSRIRTYGRYDRYWIENPLHDNMTVRLANGGYPMTVRFDDSRMYLNDELGRRAYRLPKPTAFIYIEPHHRTTTNIEISP